MIEFLLAVPGRTKKLLDRLTATRAANLDYLDVAVSTRAAAATAVSNADYTAARAAKLDNVILASVLNSNIQTGFVGNIGTVGTAEDEYYTDVAISSVVIAKSLVIIHQWGDASRPAVTARLTSTTNLRLSASELYAGARWYVIEFK